jgi:hypothetical protein
MQVSQAVSICHKKGIHIYPELIKDSWYIFKEHNGKIVRGTNPHTLAAINNQKNHIVSKAYIHYANLESF